MDVSSEGVSAKWSSLAAPLMPSLLMSREASSSLFDTPWRSKKSPVVSMRRAALYVLNTFENDLECQKSWLSFCGVSLRSCLHLTAGEVIGWSYTFVFLLATLLGASSVSSALGLGSVVYRLYLVGCVRSFLAFIYEIVCLLQDGPLLHAKELVRSKAKTFVLSMLASAILPKDVLAAHMTACVLFGFMEKTLKCIFRLSIPSLIFMANIKDMGNAYASRLVDAVLGALRGSPPPKPLPALCEGREVATSVDVELLPVPKQDVSPEEDAMPAPVESPLKDTVDPLPFPCEEVSEAQPYEETFQKNAIEEDAALLNSSAVPCEPTPAKQAHSADFPPRPLDAILEEEGQREGRDGDAPTPEKQLLKIKWKACTANPRLHRRTLTADA